MPREIPKAYEPQEIEERWARYWFDEKLFVADVKDSRPHWSISIPPPNVTGSLHIGHMLDHTEIDILTRWKRMAGFNTLWLPGTDHAGIATQKMVQDDLWKKEKKTRHDLGREEFLKRVWAWKAQSGGRIHEQFRVMGFSCAWSYHKFT